MIEILAPISNMPGVRMAGVVTSDGVPIVAPGAASEDSHSMSATVDVEALSAIAIQYYDELSRLTGELTWDRPQRVVVRGARGTLIVRTIRGGVLMALLDSGVGADQLRLPMEGAAMRIARVLSSMGGNLEPMPERPQEAPGRVNQPRAALPLDGSGANANNSGEENPANNPTQARD